MRVDFVTFLVFDGEGQEAVEYYQQIFKDEFELIQMMTFGELDGSLISKKEQDKVMYAEIRLYGKIILLSDCADFYHKIFSKGTNVMLSIALSEASEVERLFNAFTEEGTLIFGLADTEVTELFGIVTDKFGLTWQFSKRPKGRKLEKFN